MVACRKLVLNVQAELLLEIPEDENKLQHLKFFPVTACLEIYI
jgi:hypothetical protein